jgi:uncharacterized protein YrrD
MIKFKDIKGFEVTCTNESVGKIKDVSFDELSNSVRYLVIDTSSWLPGKKVLVKPDAVSRVDMSDEQVQLKLSKSKFEESPSLESDLPVSRQHEEALHTYHGMAPYWSANLHLGGSWFPYPAYPISSSNLSILGRNYPVEWQELQERRRERFDNHLRSCDEVCGYKIASRDDEEFGEVSDMIIDVNIWQVVDLVLSSRKWLPGGKTFACSPMFVDAIDENKEVLNVDLKKQTLLDSPEFDFSRYDESSHQQMVEHYLSVIDQRPGPNRGKYHSSQAANA